MSKYLLVAAMLFSTVVSAQKFQFGAKAGINISNFTGGDFEDVEKKALVGFHGGVYLRFALANISIQPEAMISTQGAKIDSVSGSYDWKLTYINVPVMVQYRFTGGVYIEAGPQVGFKIDESIPNQTIDEFANGLDFSIAAGLGYRTKGGLGLGGRYTVGVSKVGDFEPSNGINPDFKNGVIQISVYIPLTR